MRKDHICEASDILPTDIIRGYYVSWVRYVDDNMVHLMLCSRLWPYEYKDTLRLPRQVRVVVKRKRRLV